MSHLNIVANGLGGQSMWLLHLAGTGVINATVSITADTGSENDRQTNTGERTSAVTFFREVVKPLAKSYGIDAKFVRSRDEDGNRLAPLIDDMEEAAEGRTQDAPLFGSDGGRLRQTCTDKYKIRAIRQEARRLGATSMRSAIGLHVNEYMRRANGRIIGKEGPWTIFQDGETRDDEWRPIKWLTHYYPLVTLKLSRDIIGEKLKEAGIPYLVTTECDHCPHKDGPRWLRSSPETIERVAALEAKYKGEFFFTDRRIPLKVAMEQFRAEAAQPSLYDDSFGCSSGGYCGL